MRFLFILLACTINALYSFAQAIPDKETVFNIQKKDKQSFEFFLQKGYTLKALIKQMGIDLCVSIYKKGEGQTGLF